MHTKLHQATSKKNYLKLNEKRIQKMKHGNLVSMLSLLSFQDLLIY